MEILIISLLILISFLICHKSKKITESFQPDERKFTYCLNYDNTNQVSHPYYGIVANSIKQPPDRTGLFTSLVNKPLNFTSLKSIPHWSESAGVPSKTLLSRQYPSLLPTYQERPQPIGLTLR